MADLRYARLKLVVLGALVALVGLLVAGVQPAATAPGLVVDDMSDGAPTAQQLANFLVGGGVTVSNATYSGASVAAGTFSGDPQIIGFGSGVILSTGRADAVVGPNDNDATSHANGTPGDAQMTTLAGGQTFDASILQFDFQADSPEVFFNYVFASEEYNEFVYQGFNDVFAFYVNGDNCAVVATATGVQPVSVDTINGGNPFGDPNASNPQLFRNNDLDNGGGAIDTEMDGLTTVLTCRARVRPGQTNTLRLVIADAGDDVYDSNVFIQAGSFTTNPTTTTAPPTTAPTTAPPTTAPPTTRAPTTSTTRRATTTTVRRTTATTRAVRPAFTGSGPILTDTTVPETTTTLPEGPTTTQSPLLTTTTTTPEPETIELASSPSAAPGGKTRVRGRGCRPNEAVIVSVDGQQTGRTQANAGGAFDAEVQLPTLEVGRHSIEARCGEVVTRSTIDFVIATSGASASATVAAVFGFFALLGAILFFFAASQGMQPARRNAAAAAAAKRRDEEDDF